MKKLILFTLLLGIFTSTVSCGGGDGVNHYTTTSAKKASKTTKSTINDSVETEPAPEVPEKLLNIQEARQFNNGVAWVKSDNGWNIVDTEGNIVKTFDANYAVTTDFIGGYSIITVGSNVNKIIVNTKGETVLDLSAQGYTELYNYDGLDMGSVVVNKKLDSFDKSGIYHFHYDLNTQTEKEMLPAIELYRSPLIYVGNGFYVISGKGATRKEYEQERFVFHNYFNDTTLSFLDDAFEDGVDEYHNYDVSRVGDFVVGHITALYRKSMTHTEDVEKCFTFDLVNNQSQQILTDGVCFDIPDDKIWNNGAYIDINYTHLFNDFETGQFTEFKPNCDYRCDIQDYNNGYFFVTTENENRTEFFTVIDWNMNPLFTPKRYSDTTTFIKDYIVYNEENGAGTIMYIPDNAVIKEFPDSEVIYTDKSNLYVWVRNKDNTVECFDIKTGNQILKLDGAYDILTDFSDGLVAVNSTETNEKSYINMSGEKLKITE
ncbi:MAG: hypothetical protein K2G36_02440 [Ruminococcus sp.]|nr:hypothetical protein [Ruminococcus sp.]